LISDRFEQANKQVKAGTHLFEFDLISFEEEMLAFMTGFFLFDLPSRVLDFWMEK
jgi:hypothetical protein